MATNTGNKYRIGAVLDRFQLLDIASGFFVKFCASTGKILQVKKSPGPFKGVSSKVPKKYR